MNLLDRIRAEFGIYSDLIAGNKNTDNSIDARLRSTESILYKSATNIPICKFTNLIAAFDISADTKETDIIGLYDPSPMNCLTNRISGILFLKDLFVYKKKPSSTPVKMRYDDITKIEALTVPFDAIISGKNGGQIILEGSAYSCNSIVNLFKDIIHQD